MLKDDYATALVLSIEEGAKPEKALQGLDAALASRGHEKLKGAVLNTAVAMLEAKRETDTTLVTVADKEQAKKLKDAIKRATNRLGETEHTKTVEDETLIGGFTIEQNGKILDQSYKSALLSLYRNITLHT